MAIYRLNDDEPVVPATAWVAESAQVIGRVRLGEYASVWYGAVIRGDNEWITIGDRSNVQECAVLHVDPGYPLVIGRGVTIGHHAMVHGCTINDDSLVGIRAVVLNAARIGSHCLVGAGAVVTEEKAFDEGSLILGAPAKAVRMLSAEQIAGITGAAQRYVENAARHRGGAVRIA